MYLQFKHVPLYLEWAPLGVFSGKPEEKLAEETTGTAKENKVYNVITFVQFVCSVVENEISLKILTKRSEICLTLRSGMSPIQTNFEVCLCSMFSLTSRGGSFALLKRITSTWPLPVRG